MKLFLASSLDKSVELLSKKLGSFSGKKVIFIANASDNHIGDKWWIETDRKAFMKLGCVIKDIDLRDISEKEFLNELSNSHIIHFCGGSVLYLISLIKNKKLDKIIVDFVRNNKIIYTGTSAGSMIVAKDVFLSSFDLEEKEYVKNIKDYSGLDLVNFLIIPHCNNEDFTQSNLSMVKELSKTNQSLVFIFDNQAVWVEDDKISILKV